MRIMAKMCGRVALGATLCLAAGCVVDDIVDSILPPLGREVMLADNTRLARSAGGTGYVAQPTGLTANVSHPSASTRAHFEEVAPDLVTFAGIDSWASTLGRSPIRFETSRQLATATYVSTSYSFSGFGFGAAYDADDELTVAFDDDEGEEVAITVAAPPRLGNPASVLGEPAGLSTLVRIPDGFDYLYVYVVADDGQPGDDGLMRRVFADDMALDEGYRTAPLLDGVAIDALDERNLTALMIYFAYFNAAISTQLFPDEAMPVQAGRMFQIDVADLAPL